MFVENGNVPAATDTPFVVGTYIASGEYSFGFQVYVGFAPSAVIVQSTNCSGSSPSTNCVSYLIGKTPIYAPGFGEIGSLTANGFKVTRPECINLRDKTYNYIAFR